MRWHFPSRPLAVHPSFVNSLPSFLPGLSKNARFEIQKSWREGLYLHYKASTQYNLKIADLEQGRLQTVMTVFAPKGGAWADERVVLCPLSGTQARCLACLWQRWGFVPKLNSRVTPLMKDVYVGLLYEMLRVLVHPFLSGCSERVLVEESGDAWPAAFRKASARVGVMEHLLQGVMDTGTAHTRGEQKGFFFVYSRTVPMCQKLQKYFAATGRDVVCLFGVKTQEELDAEVLRLRSGCGAGVTIVILGQLPTACSLCLDFVERVVVFDSDLIPSTDFEYLTSKFHIALHRVSFLPSLHPSEPPSSDSSRQLRWRWPVTSPPAPSSISSRPSSKPPLRASPTPSCFTHYFASR